MGFLHSKRAYPRLKPLTSMCVCVCVCVCVCIGGFSGTHTQIISGKWGIQKQWGYPQIQKSLVKQSRGSMHAIGCPLALLESSIFPPVTGRKSYLLCNFFKHFFVYLMQCFWGHRMNTHRESGVKFMSPVSLPNLRFPENHLIRVCVCVHVCVFVTNMKYGIHKLPALVWSSTKLDKISKEKKRWASFIH